MAYARLLGPMTLVDPCTAVELPAHYVQRSTAKCNVADEAGSVALLACHLYVQSKDFALVADEFWTGIRGALVPVQRLRGRQPLVPG